MGINPSMGMTYGMGGEDFYTQMLYQQMANGSTGFTGNGTTGTNNNTKTQTQETKNGGGLGSALMYGGGAAALTGAGMYFTNNPFNSPLEAGKKVFNEDFLKHFSGEYAAMQNGDKLEKFYKGLSTTKVPVTAENFSTTMDSIEEFIKSGDVDDLTDEAKAVLKKKHGITATKKADIDAALKALDKNDLKSFYTETVYNFAEHNVANNLNAKNAMLAQLDDLKEGWKSLGKGADSAVAKAEFLRENAHVLGIDKADYQTLIQKADDFTDDSALNNLWEKYAGKKGKIKTRKTAIEGEIKTIKKQMQSFASKWDGKANFFGTSGFKKFGNQKQLNALEGALSSMKKCKAGKYAAIAAGIAAVGSFFLNA